jgi:hypothetical protein
MLAPRRTCRSDTPEEAVGPGAATVRRVVEAGPHVAGRRRRAVVVRACRHVLRIRRIDCRRRLVLRAQAGAFVVRVGDSGVGLGISRRAAAGGDRRVGTAVDPDVRKRRDTYVRGGLGHGNKECAREQRGRQPSRHETPVSLDSGRLAPAYPLEKTRTCLCALRWMRKGGLATALPCTEPLLRYGSATPAP